MIIFLLPKLSKVIIPCFHRKSCHTNLCPNCKLEKKDAQFKFVLRASSTASTINKQMTLLALISLPPMIRFDEKMHQCYCLTSANDHKFNLINKEITIV
ncbi:hypothetical protein QUC31_006004 [Theobroma cacao]